MMNAPIPAARYSTSSVSWANSSRLSVKVTAVTRMIMAMTRALRSFRSFISSQGGKGRCRQEKGECGEGPGAVTGGEGMIGDVYHRVHRDRDPVDERADPGQHQDG